LAPVTSNGIDEGEATSETAIQRQVLAGGSGDF